MAERRMFSKAVVSSARFLRMPQTSRLLYYDLGMAADDDGVVEAFTVIRTTGAAEDDLRVLVAKGFITVLNEDLVSYITDWRINNQLRKDRYHRSVYAELLVKLADGNQVEPIWQPDGNQRETEVSIGKGSIVKEREGADKPPRPRFIPPTVDEVKAYCQERHSSVDPVAFVSFYESKGWMVGKNKMRSWKSAISSWERRDGSSQAEQLPTMPRVAYHTEIVDGEEVDVPDGP